jgi:hypothetical protein
MAYNPRQPNLYDLQGPPAPTTNTGGGRGASGGGGFGGGGFGGGDGWWNPFRNATFQGRALFPRQNVAYQQNQANQVQNAFADATVTPTDPRAGFHDAEYWRNIYGSGGAGAAQPTAPAFPDRDMADRSPMAPKGSPRVVGAEVAPFVMPGQTAWIVQPDGRLIPSIGAQPVMPDRNGGGRGLITPKGGNPGRGNPLNEMMVDYSKAGRSGRRNV